MEPIVSYNCYILGIEKITCNKFCEMFMMFISQRSEGSGTIPIGPLPREPETKACLHTIHYMHEVSLRLFFQNIDVVYAVAPQMTSTETVHYRYLPVPVLFQQTVHHFQLLFLFQHS